MGIQPSKFVRRCQTLLINAGAARREVVNGREFLVAPMTIIVPGVLNGSRGALLYPPSEVAREPGMWNGVPIVRNHPVENGQHVSGRTPSAMASVEMGRVYNDRWDGKKRTAEGWFDVEATKRVDNAIYERLVKGDKIELSTGLFTDNQDRKGVWNGKAYDAIAFNYRPDHLAILPDQRGACSLEDGCGVMVNSFCPGEGARVNSCSSSGGGSATSRSESAKSLTDRSGNKYAKKAAAEAVEHAKQASQPVDEKVVTSRRNAELAHKAAAEAHGKAMMHHENAGQKEAAAAHQKAGQVHSDLASKYAAKLKANQDDSQSGPECKCGGTCGGCSPAPVGKVKNAFAPRTASDPRRESGQFKPMGSGTGKGPPHWAAQKGMLVPSEEDRRLGKLASDEKAALGNNPASWVADEATWEKAKEAAGKSYDEGDDAYWPSVAAIYKKMGGEVRSNDQAPTKNAFTANTRSTLMAKQRNGREEVLDWLTNNVSSLKGGQVRDALDELPDEALGFIHNSSQFAAEKTLVCNALAELLPEVNDVVANGGDIKAFLKSKMGGGDEPDGDEEDQYQENQGCGEMKGSGDGQMMTAKAMNIDAGDDCSGDDQDDECRAAFAAMDRNSERGGRKVTSNRTGGASNKAQRRMSLNEMIQQHGTDEERSAWGEMIANEREQRRELLQRITANCGSEEERKLLWNELKGDSLGKLKALANRFAPRQQKSEGDSRGLFGVGMRIPDYAGAGGAVVANRSQGWTDEGNIPDPPALIERKA